MSVRLDGNTIRLEGDCHVEQAEELVRFLEDDPRRPVDISGCRHLHGAVAQVLLTLGATVCGTPEDPFLRDLVLRNFLDPHRPTKTAKNDLEHLLHPEASLA